MIRKILGKLRCYRGNHDWVSSGAPACRRICLRCGREEWLMENRFPAPEEPRYYWTWIDRG